MNNKFVHTLYSFRHLIATLVTIISIVILKIISVYIYIVPPKEIGFIEFYKLLWQSGSAYYQLIVIMNILVKPLFIYALTLFILSCLSMKKITSKESE